MVVGLVVFWNCGDFFYLEFGLCFLGFFLFLEVFIKLGKEGKDSGGSSLMSIYNRKFE